MGIGGRNLLTPNAKNHLLTRGSGLARRPEPLHGNSVTEPLACVLRIGSLQRHRDNRSRRGNRSYCNAIVRLRGWETEHVLYFATNPLSGRALRPNLFCSPPSIRLRAFVKCVPKPSRRSRIANICLFNRVRDNDDEAKVLARNRIVGIVCLGAQLEVLVIVWFVD